MLDEVEGSSTKRHIVRWHFDLGVNVRALKDTFIARKGGKHLEISFSSESRITTRLYRDSKWMKPYTETGKHKAPWVLGIKFGGRANSSIETRFKRVPA